MFTYPENPYQDKITTYSLPPFCNFIGVIGVLPEKYKNFENKISKEICPSEISSFYKSFEGLNKTISKFLIYCFIEKTKYSNFDLITDSCE